MSSILADQQLSVGPPLGRTYAAPAVCWGGGTQPPPPLFGFGEVRICCIRVHQLKGQFSRFFASGLFDESVSPQPQSIALGPFRIFFENSRR